MLKHRYIDGICMAAALAAMILTVLFMHGKNRDHQSDCRSGICEQAV